MDSVSKEARSRNMSAIRSKNTKPELIIRRGLHAIGFRFRLHKKELTGKPDIYLPKYKTVVFIHGCFWHQHENCKNAIIPKTNSEFWEIKLNGNVMRDIDNINKLNDDGFNVIVVWECTVKKHLKDKTIPQLIEIIKRIIISEEHGVSEV